MIQEGGMENYQIISTPAALRRRTLSYAYSTLLVGAALFMHLCIPSLWL